LGRGKLEKLRHLQDTEQTSTVAKVAPSPVSLRFKEVKPRRIPSIIPSLHRKIFVSHKVPESKAGRRKKRLGETVPLPRDGASCLGNGLKKKEEAE